MAAVVLARRGARVTAFDLSARYVAEAAARTRANGVSVTFLQADGYRLPFADGNFDRVWGNAVLHHLHLDAPARQPRRGHGPRWGRPPRAASRGWCPCSNRKRAQRGGVDASSSAAGGRDSFFRVSRAAPDDYLKPGRSTPLVPAKDSADLTARAPFRQPGSTPTHGGTPPR